jgi:hypothetical protein
MSNIDINIEIIKQTPYYFTDSVTNDVVMYTGYQTQHMLFGTTSNDSSIINIFNSNITFNRLGNFSCNLTIGSNSYIGITNYVALQTNIDFAAINSSNSWATNHGGKAIYMRYSTYSNDDASFIQSIYRDGLSTSMLDMQLQASNLHLCTGNTSTQIQLTVKPDGKIGIGTSNPSENLHVKNNIRINGHIALDALMPIKFGSNSATNTAAQMGFNLVNNSNFLDVIGGATASQTGRQIYFWINSNQTGGVPGRATFEGGTVWLTTGSLGICRSNPVSLLHLTSNSKCYTTYTNTLNSNTGIIVGIEDNAGGGMFYNTSNSYLKFGTNNIERLKIASNGYIGIGVSNPNGILHVHSATDNTLLHLTNSSSGSNAGTGFDINFDTSKNMSMWNYENGYIRFGTNNIERVKIITSTTKMVQVNGDVSVTNGMYRIDSTNPFYFDTYGGGWFMNDTTWIRAYADKNIYTGGIISTSNKLGVGTSSPNYLLEVKSTAGTGSWLSSFSNNSVITLLSDSTGNGLQVNTGQNSSTTTFAISLCNASSNLFKVTNNGVGVLASNLTCTGLSTGQITSSAINCTTITTNNNSITCGTISSTSINTNANQITSGPISCTTLTTNNNTLTCGPIVCTTISTNNNTLTCGNITCGTINTSGSNITCSRLTANTDVYCQNLYTNNTLRISSTGALTSITLSGSSITSGTVSASYLPIATTSGSGIVMLIDSTSSYSTSAAATPNSVRSAYDRGTTGINNASTAQNTANNAASAASSAYSRGDSAYNLASSAQNTANNAMPRSGGTFTNKINISAPGNTKLAIDNDTSTNRHIVLWDINNDQHRFYGIGINAGLFRFSIDGQGSRYGFNVATSSTTSTEIMTINGSGFVQINGYTQFNSGVGNGYSLLSGPPGPGAVAYTNWGIGVSLRTNGGIVVDGWGVFVSSDIRIKKDLQDINDENALKILRNIEPKTFKYKDSITRGNDMVYGFIAQDVVKILPYAVSSNHDGFIPNIYSMANVNSNIITFDKGYASNLDFSSLGNNNLELQLYDMNNIKYEVKIDQVLNDYTIALKESIKHDRVFVFGQKVYDFNILNKDDIYTVGIAALQEVDRQLQTNITKVSQLENKINIILQRLDLANI